MRMLKSDVVEYFKATQQELQICSFFIEQSYPIFLEARRLASENSLTKDEIFDGGCIVGWCGIDYTVIFSENAWVICAVDGNLYNLDCRFGYEYELIRLIKKIPKSKAPVWVAGSVSGQVQQNFHAWSRNVRSFRSKSRAEKYGLYVAKNDCQEGEAVFVYEL